MASSTMKPTATTTATSVRLFRLKPIRYMAAKVAARDTTSTAATTSVADHWRRNSAITPITNAMVITSVNSTSCREARIVRVRSLVIST